MFNLEVQTNNFIGWEPQNIEVFLRASKTGQADAQRPDCSTYQAARALGLGLADLAEFNDSAPQHAAILRGFCISRRHVFLTVELHAKKRYMGLAMQPSLKNELRASGRHVAVAALYLPEASPSKTAPDSQSPAKMAAVTLRLHHTAPRPAPVGSGTPPPGP